MVEAFSIRGLGLLADSWASHPPFPDDAAFGASIARYRDNLLTKYRTASTEQGAIGNLAAWFQSHRADLETNGGVTGPAQGVVWACLEEMQADTASVDGLGAVNRWPGRSGVPLEDYLRLWKRSCVELGESPRLPIRLRNRLLG